MRESTIKAGLITSSILTGLFISEVVLRIFFDAPMVSYVSGQKGYVVGVDQKTAPNPGSLQAGSQRTNGLYVITDTGRRLRPSARAEIFNHPLTKRNIVVETNSFGFRGRELEAKKHPRVLFLGDSITMSDHLPDNETFVRIFEQLSATIRPFEAINAGIMGIGLEDELQVLKENGLATNPDVVVLVFYLNDVMTSPGVRIISPPSFLSRSWLAAYVFRAISILRARALGEDELNVDIDTLRKWHKEISGTFPPDVGDPLTKKAAFHAQVLNNFHDWGNAWSGGVWEYLFPKFKEFHRLARKHQFLPIIVVSPVRTQVEAVHLSDFPQRKIKEIGELLEIPVLDLLPGLREARKESDLEFYYDHCHTTAWGSRLYAKLILEFLYESKEVQALFRKSL